MAVCTIEKANGALNKMIQQARLGNLCCVIVDVSTFYSHSLQMTQHFNTVVSFSFPANDSR